MNRPIPRRTPGDGALSRHAAYTLVAQYLAAIPPAGAEADARLWRAVDLALDATGLPAMTAPALNASISVADAAARLEAPAGRWPYRPDELHGGTIGAHNDGESPHWRNLVDEHGLDAARDVIIGRITAGGPITGLPASWEDHLDWSAGRELGDAITARHGQPFTDGELGLLADLGVPAYAVAAILCRYPGAIEKKRQRIRSGKH